MMDKQTYQQPGWLKNNWAISLVIVVLFFMTVTAHAGVSQGLWTRASHVGDTVTDNGNGTWDYGYTVFNDSFADMYGTDPFEPLIVDWELPYFSDAGISNIISPYGWTYAIETIGVANPLTGWEGVAAWQDPSDPFYAGADSPFTHVTEVLHWYSICWVQTTIQPPCEWELQDAIFVGDNLSGFGFTAVFDETAAPYQASWALLPIQSGDPAFPLGGLPASPNTLGITPPPTIPEPTTLSLLGLGLLGAAYSINRRRKTPSV